MTSEESKAEPTKSEPPSTWESFSSAMKYTGMLITTVAVLKVVRHNVPGMEFGAVLSFLVETYRSTVYPIFDLLFGWLFRWLDFRLSENIRDILTGYLLISAAYGRAFKRMIGWDLEKAGCLGLYLRMVLFFMALFWLPVVIGVTAAFIVKRPERFVIEPLVMWGRELLVILGGVSLALLVNLVT